MINTRLLNTLTEKIARIFPAELSDCRQELSNNLKAVLQGVFSNLDLVTREEFEAQKKVLLKTREKLALMELELAALEQTVQAQSDSH